MTLSNDSVEGLAKDFVCLRLDPRQNEIVSSKFNVESIPDVRILLPDGTETFRGGAGTGAKDLAEAMHEALAKCGRAR